MANKNNQPLAMGQKVILTELAGCEECDAIYRKIDLLPNERAYCTCCGAELYRRSRSFSSLLALVLTALIVFVIANSFPIVIVELQGNTSQTTLIGAAWTMFHIDRALVGVLILITTFIVPLVELLLLSYVLFFIGLLKRRPQYLRLALRALFLFRIWGMVEVFLIGVLVTLVKLVGMVTVIPGIALWAFTLLSVLLVYIASIKIKDLWDEVDRSLG
ncbi:paraquat-inducible protein A [Acinetobacter colistiniresistens]|uniref:Paraquat-inducible protein A n=1 Tax=Acinetobacter colistiniresistens TaxID=280145 RepID=S3TB98_9GAMM|nr:paraquat-inducible protein A [Acinetobacter colistiniresistens]EPG36959.1 paraquat-inducible protein A [Acinetobacter colistiniresistens]TVT82903.1 paraquat-inducible protein A [Acinetobacter colistiniresistens]